MPVLAPHNCIGAEGPTRHRYTTEWLADVIICYAIRRGKLLRFVTGWDLGRWNIDGARLHRRAIANLAALPWLSRLLHAELHKLFSGALGSTFWACIPNRNTLVLFSDRRALKQRIARSLRKDHHGSAYPVAPPPFLVTRDGIAAAPVKR